MQYKPTIGLLTPFLGGNYLGEIINSIQKAARNSEVRLVAIRTAGKPYDCPIAVNHVDVAEGVEQKEQYDLLQELGCHYMQGFYISRPLPADKFEQAILINNGLA